MKDKECNKTERDSKPMHRPRLFGGDLLGFLTENDLPAMNFKESKQAYKLELSAPGFDKEDFSIQVDGNTLTVKGNDTKEIYDKDDSEITIRQGFVNSSFTRSFTLPKDADAEKIQARMKNGMLTVKIYKKELLPEPIRNIDIE